MAHREFTLGALVRLSVLSTQDGSPIDPTEVTLIVKAPDGNEATHVYNGGAGTVQKAGTGSYFYDYDAAAAGTVEYRWKTTSPQGAQENYIVVAPSRVASP